MYKDILDRDSSSVEATDRRLGESDVVLVGRDLEHPPSVESLRKLLSARSEF